jgi:hypothetical protein
MTKPGASFCPFVPSIPLNQLTIPSPPAFPPTFHVPTTAEISSQPVNSFSVFFSSFATQESFTIFTLRAGTADVK